MNTTVLCQHRSHCEESRTRVVKNVPRALPCAEPEAQPPRSSRCLSSHIFYHIQRRSTDFLVSSPTTFGRLLPSKPWIAESGPPARRPTRPRSRCNLIKDPTFRQDRLWMRIGAELDMF